MSLHNDLAVQAGTPMTAIGDVSLSPWLETERPLSPIIYPKISRGTSVGLPSEVGQRPAFALVAEGGAW